MEPYSLAELGTLVATLLGLVAVVAVALRAGEKERAASAEFVAAVRRAFEELARRRGLSVDQPEPILHPIVGEVHGAPSLAGSAHGCALKVTLEDDSDGHAPLVVAIKLTRRGVDGSWPTFTAPRRDPRALECVTDGAREALVQLCAIVKRVAVTPSELLAHVTVPLVTDEGPRPRSHVVVDVERIEACLDCAMRFAAATAPA